MKKTIQLGLLLLFATAIVSPLLAQDAKNEDMVKLAKKYEAAYNKKDDKALKDMYTKDATRTDTEGTVLSGSEAIRAALAAAFAETDASAKLIIMQDKTETAADGAVTSTGTYVATGKTKAGEAFELKGSYTNTVVKEGGQWKIAKSVLSGM